MKENSIPTKDLKTGAKVVYVIGERSFEAVKPHLKHYASRKIERVLRAISEPKF